MTMESGEVSSCHRRRRRCVYQSSAPTGFLVVPCSHCQQAAGNWSFHPSHLVCALTLPCPAASTPPIHRSSMSPLPAFVPRHRASPALNPNKTSFSSTNLAASSRAAAGGCTPVPQPHHATAISRGSRTGCSVRISDDPFLRHVTWS